MISARHDRPDATDNAARMALSRAAGGGGGGVPYTGPNPLCVNFATGDDSNPGTALLPIKTIARANVMIGGKKFTDTIMEIDFQVEPDPSEGAIDFTTSSGFILSLQGVFVNVAGPSTITGVTPYDAATNQQLVLTDAAVPGGDFAAYVDKFIVNTTVGARFGSSSAIVKTDGGATHADCSNPMIYTAPITTSGGDFQMGDTYRIQRPMNLKIVPPRPGSFFDCLFGRVKLASEAPIAAFVGLLCPFVLCDVNLDTGGIVAIQSIFVLAGSIVRFTDTRNYFSAFSFDRGLVRSTGLAFVDCVFNGVLNGTYFTGDTEITVGDGVLREMFLNEGQFQDFTSNAIAAMIGATISVNTLSGNGNGGLGLKVYPGVTVDVVRPDHLTLTGSTGDFGFSAVNGSTNVLVARAWDDAAGAYTEAGGVATRSTTWANLVAALGAGGFHGQAHYVEGNAHVIASAS
jgi:hypothetical protein